jgi:hypothetical protein
MTFLEWLQQHEPALRALRDALREKQTLRGTVNVDVQRPHPRTGKDYV